MYCSQCGTLVVADAAFCSKCGKPISAGASEKSSETPSATADVVKPREIWRIARGITIGILLVITYFGMFFEAFVGERPSPQAGQSSMLWTGVFFYLWWKRLGRKGWHGALIGVVLGILAFGVAAFIGAFMRSTAGT